MEKEGKNMSVENAKKFQKDLKENEELKKKFEEEMAAEGVTSEKDTKAIVKIAQKLGYDVTEEEFNNVKSGNIESMKNGELSEEELDNVAGGAFFCGPDAPDGHEVGCWWTYYDDWHAYFNSRNYRCQNCGSAIGAWTDEHFPAKICIDCRKINYVKNDKVVAEYIKTCN